MELPLVQIHLHTLITRSSSNTSAHTNNPVTEVWFKILPMGKNSIGDLMKEIKLNSPLKDLCPDKRLTNHTARKTVVKKLQSQGVQCSDIISITGHTTTRGLDAYDEGDNGFQRVLSNMIGGTASSSNMIGGTASSSNTSAHTNNLV